MVLRNPTDVTVSIQLDGTVYSIAPQGVSKELPESVVSRWTKVHEFLKVEDGVQVVDEKKVAVAPVEETDNEPIVAPEQKESTLSRIKSAVKGKK